MRFENKLASALKVWSIVPNVLTEFFFRRVISNKTLDRWRVCSELSWRNGACHHKDPTTKAEIGVYNGRTPLVYD